jgi:predicted phosphodiesterase
MRKEVPILKIGIISDIHGNAEALQVVLNELKDVDKIVCLGDIIGYGADPEYCIEKIRELDIPCIKGNHEGALTGELDLNYFNDYARRAIEWTKKKLKEQDFIYLSRLGKKITIYQDVLGVHGSPRQPLWEYILDEQTAEEVFISFDFRIYFIGHSHISGYFTFNRKNKAVNYNNALYGAEIKIKQNNSYIINCGSVGQPRDRNPQASFAIFDTDNFIVNIKRVDYPIYKAQEKINKANLPKFLAERLALGI